MRGVGEQWTLTGAFFACSICPSSLAQGITASICIPFSHFPHFTRQCLLKCIAFKNILYLFSAVDTQKQHTYHT